ncbi:cytospin-A-like, partial [Mustelus asterias]
MGQDSSGAVPRTGIGCGRYSKGTDSSPDEEDAGNNAARESGKRWENPEATEQKEIIAKLEVSDYPTVKHSAHKLVANLKAERLSMKEELERLNERMKSEEEEWRQFQNDMQLAVTVADRLRTEAESEAESLRRRLEEEAGKTRRLQQELEKRDSVDAVDGKRIEKVSDVPEMVLDGTERSNGTQYWPHLRFSPPGEEGNTAK